MPTDQTVNAWYFSWPDHRIAYRSRRKAALGVTHHYRGKPEVEGAGMHAGLTVRTALDLSPQPVAWRVELSGHIHSCGTSIAAQRRRYLGGGVDVSPVLCEWARRCVLSLIDRARPQGVPSDVTNWLDSDGKAALRNAALLSLDGRRRSHIEELAYRAAITPDMCGMNLVRNNLYIANKCVAGGGIPQDVADMHLSAMVSRRILRDGLWLSPGSDGP